MSARFAAALLFASLPALSLAQNPTALPAGATFELFLNAKPVGTDTVRFNPTKHGSKAVSNYHFAIRAEGGDYSSEYTFVQDFSLEMLGVNEKLDQPTLVSFTPNKARTELTQSRVSNGRQDLNIITIKPNLVILPTFDAAATQAFLLQALQAGAPAIFNVFVPHLDGIPGKDAQVEAKFSKGPAFHGTLDGKPVEIQAYLLASSDFRWIFYATPDAALMQLDLPLARAIYRRTGFSLDPQAPASNAVQK